MSTLNDEDLLVRLNLLESSVPHAWVSWDDPKTIYVEKSTCEDILPKGDYKLENMVTGECLKNILSYYQNISNTTLETNFTIKNNGQVCDVTCASILKEGEVRSLWFVIPEKDNSIFYLQNAAHDFRSPLASILGVVNLMHHSIKNDEEIDRGEMTTYLDMIKVNTDKTLRLADEIMELAEIESESYDLKMKPIVVKDFMSNYLATHRLLTLKKKITVQFESDLNSEAMINESKLTRALDNIMSNAVKFSKPESNIKVQLTEENDVIRLTISDQGIGMTPDILKNVFVKFGSSKRDGLDGEPSHGLGMSIVQQIMRLHGGNVEITSKEGMGTSVSLILKKKQ
ncbi:sensor histidine kinase [Ekhidna sp.]|uniref:sensor histidine kinase n=1 Tax=Ekhidna sp. TaxID=2608089 RepID=UPI003C7A2319